MPGSDSLLSTGARELIDREIAKYQEDQKRSAVMAALRIAQNEQGWLSTELMAEVADYLKIPPVAVYEIATFYTMYNTRPVGKYKFLLCTNLPCVLSGAGVTAEYLKGKLGIGFGETTPDGLFTLEESECMGACDAAPVMLINNHKMCSHMTPEEIDKKLEMLRNK